MLVTPGVRPPARLPDDQKRIATPAAGDRRRRRFHRGRAAHPRRGRSGRRGSRDRARDRARALQGAAAPASASRQELAMRSCSGCSRCARRCAPTARSIEQVIVEEGEHPQLEALARFARDQGRRGHRRASARRARSPRARRAPSRGDGDVPELRLLPLSTARGRARRALRGARRNSGSAKFRRGDPQRGGLRRQRRSVARALVGAAVGGDVSRLGRRHRARGALPRHFPAERACSTSPSRGRRPSASTRAATSSSRRVDLTGPVVAGHRVRRQRARRSRFGARVRTSRACRWGAPSTRSTPA